MCYKLRKPEAIGSCNSIQLTEEEKAEVVASCDYLARLKFSPVLPRAFTEHGAIRVQGIVRPVRVLRRAGRRRASSAHGLGFDRAPIGKAALGGGRLLIHQPSESSVDRRAETRGHSNDRRRDKAQPGARGWRPNLAGFPARSGRILPKPGHGATVPAVSGRKSRLHFRPTGGQTIA